MAFMGSVPAGARNEAFVTVYRGNVHGSRRIRAEFGTTDEHGWTRMKREERPQRGTRSAKKDRHAGGTAQETPSASTFFLRFLCLFAGTPLSFAQPDLTSISLPSFVLICVPLWFQTLPLSQKSGGDRSLFLLRHKVYC
jgi:hypothetical protein